MLVFQYKSHDHTSHQGTSSKLQDSCGQVPDPRVRKYTSPTEMGEGSEYFTNSLTHHTDQSKMLIWSLEYNENSG